MRIELEQRGSHGAASLFEADDLKHLSITQLPGQQFSPGQIIGPVEFASPETAWIDREWLSRAWERAGCPGGEAVLQAMYEFAEKSGWADQHGRIRVHVEVGADGGGN